jgi:hypothetical protein
MREGNGQVDAWQTTIGLPSVAGLSTGDVAAVCMNKGTEAVAIGVVQHSKKLQVVRPFVRPKGLRDAIHGV